jgi:hypothetical protein
LDEAIASGAPMRPSTTRRPDFAWKSPRIGPVPAEGYSIAHVKSGS